jgi:hypothetical protein
LNSGCLTRPASDAVKHAYKNRSRASDFLDVTETR